MNTPIQNPDNPMFLNFSNWLVSEITIDEAELSSGVEITINEDNWTGATSEVAPICWTVWLRI
jgi:hypothetical protein